MKHEITITIGWTIHDGPGVNASPRIHQGKPYAPFWDTYRPGQPQHTETITVELPDLLDHPEAIEGKDIAEAVFVATNAPFATGLAAQIAEAIAATGYHGEQAHYSLSVGDTVTVHGQTWACGRIGWEVVSA